MDGKGWNLMGMKYTQTPAERPEKFKNVPEMRLRGDDVSRLLEIFAVWEQMDRLSKDEDFCRRCRAVPGGLRDLKMLAAVVAKLADALVWTIPQEKVVGFIRTLKRMRFSVVQGPVASKPKGDSEEIVTTEELDELVCSAWEHRCRLCVDGNCDRCGLGRVLDNLVSKDRDGRSWSMMDIRRKVNE